MPKPVFPRSTLVSAMKSGRASATESPRTQRRMDPTVISPLLSLLDSPKDKVHPLSLSPALRL